jgi:hypothetical protein
MINLFSKAGKAMGYLGGGLTLITFAQGIQNNKQNKTIIANLEKRIKMQNEIIDKYQDLIKKGDDYAKLTSKVLEINDKTELALKESDKLTEISKKLGETNLNSSNLESLKSDLVFHNKNLEENISSTNKNMETLKKMLQDIFDSNSNDKFLGDHIFIEFQNYLSSLPLEKIGALGHILISIAILMSLVSIIFIFYGDFLIKYFNLEEKFPKLARFIQFRRKFQQYYFAVNICFIILALFLIIYVNYIVFIN